VKQCAVLFVDPREEPTAHQLVLKRLGFEVRVTSTWPRDETLREADVVVVIVEIPRAAMIAARLRARAGFGRRLLIALVPSPLSPSDRRNMVASGFDDAVAEGSAPRALGRRLLKRLRAHPDTACAVIRNKPRARKRSAA
jgi:hypothetical protein